MRRRDRPWYPRFPCGACNGPISERSAYYIDGDATPRCWLCHCKALGVWGGRGPRVELDEDGRVVNHE